MAWDTFSDSFFLDHSFSTFSRDRLGKRWCQKVRVQRVPPLVPIWMIPFLDHFLECKSEKKTSGKSVIWGIQIFGTRDLGYRETKLFFGYRKSWHPNLCVRNGWFQLQKVYFMKLGYWPLPPPFVGAGLNFDFPNPKIFKMGLPPLPPPFGGAEINFECLQMKFLCA